MEPFRAEFMKLHPDARPPTCQTDGSVGYDLTSVENAEILPQTMKMIDTGLALKSISPGFYPQLLSRSGLATKQFGLCCCGTIDPDYLHRPIKVVLFNISPEKKIIIHKGERVAQMVFLPVIHPQSQTLQRLRKKREGGLGSTGSN